ncbi:hypothetical protein HELRODRAFT_98103 [Helobdella robusta]|uniref:HSac2 domain-containing protein n=1 Tax=Helobdella robusta TaxID=6412 RepID=T1G9K7_HELRO|nr:hypothetical protein HELRODRAFT_98103 [Helobdella robusta]ESO07919.1 hypothetical protein HELRODRAFT_98103 [Helobdella robusta]
MDNQPNDFVEVAFAPSYENVGYTPNEVTENPDKPSQQHPPPSNSSSSSKAATTAAATATSSTSPLDKSNGASSELNRNRPHSASMMSRKSTLSTRSHASLSVSTYVSEYAAGKMYSYKDGSFSKAVDKCKGIFNEQDGEFMGAWLLTEIGYWDTEHEMMVLLTQESMAVVKYNFIGDNIRLWRKIYLKDINKLQIADLTYPSVTLMIPRDHGGVRLHLGTPTFLQRWNPWCNDIPLMTFTHHPTIYNKNETDTLVRIGVHIKIRIMETRWKHSPRHATGRELKVDDSPIVVESYAGLISVLHNQNKLGFNLDRNGMTF